MPPNERGMQEVKCEGKACNKRGPYAPNKRGMQEGKMCNRRRLEERHLPPKSKDISRRLFAL